MPSAFRSFPGHVAVLGDTWMRMVDTRVTWTPTGKTWGSESKPFMVSDGSVLGIAKPGEAKGDGIARAAHEKIASDLAYHLDLPIPPVVLWRRSPCPAGAHPCCSISAIAYAQPLDLGSNMNLITGPLLDDARRITSAIAVFESWIGAQDRHPGNAIIDADTSGGLRIAFIDYAHSLSHTWKVSPGLNQFVNTFAASFGGALPTVVEEVVDRIGALMEQAIESVVSSIPDDFMPPADRQLVVDQLLQRRATLRSVCGLP
jgi:hypothetical protein